MKPPPSNREGTWNCWLESKHISFTGPSAYPAQNKRVTLSNCTVRDRCKTVQSTCILLKPMNKESIEKKSVLQWLSDPLCNISVDRKCSCFKRCSVLKVNAPANPLIEFNFTIPGMLKLCQPLAKTTHVFSYYLFDWDSRLKGLPDKYADLPLVLSNK